MISLVFLNHVEKHTCIPLWHVTTCSASFSDVKVVLTVVVDSVGELSSCETLFVVYKYTIARIKI